MDLYSGQPFWLVKDPLCDYYHPLRKNIDIETVVIGSGITGALVTHELCRAGFQCCVIDKRSIATGSSAASTALLQYEIDAPLCKLGEIIGEENAVLAYVSCLQSITDLQRIFKTTGVDADFTRVPSVFYATGRKGLSLIKKEYELRKKHHLPVELLEKQELQKFCRFKAPGALINRESAQMDAYKAATGLLQYHMKTSALEIFTHTEVTGWKEKGTNWELTTGEGHTIRCRDVIIAAGFEAGAFLPEKVMQLTSTYALVSHPVDPEHLWPENSLIWNTDDPYLYIRTAGRNRIIVGGEDETFSDPVRRDKLLRKKTKILERKFRKLFPDTPFNTEMSWCGTFSRTADSLPYIGLWPGKNHVYYALGYGGNGITFSMIAAQLICNQMKGIRDEREKVFGFDRKKK